MKVLVLGGGIVGVSTAYFLGKEGHEVTVVEAKAVRGIPVDRRAGTGPPGAWRARTRPARRLGPPAPHALGGSAVMP